MSSRAGPAVLYFSVDDRVGRLVAVYIPPVIDEVGPELEGSPHIEVMSRILLADAATVSRDGLGVPGYHGCGSSPVLRTVAYLG